MHSIAFLAFLNALYGNLRNVLLNIELKKLKNNFSKHFFNLIFIAILKKVTINLCSIVF